VPADDPVAMHMERIVRMLAELAVGNPWGRLQPHDRAMRGNGEIPFDDCAKPAGGPPVTVKVLSAC